MRLGAEVIREKVGVVQEADDAQPHPVDAVRIEPVLGLQLRRRRDGARRRPAVWPGAGEGDGAKGLAHGDGRDAEIAYVTAKHDHDGLDLLPVYTPGAVVEERPPLVLLGVLPQIVDLGASEGVHQVVPGLPAGGRIGEQQRHAVETV